jgi:hypothetical protein
MTTTLIFNLPPVGWDAREASIGGVDRGPAATCSYVVRRDRLVDLELRLEESEWPDFLNFLALAQGGMEFRWYPRIGSVTYHQVVLFAPLVGTQVTPVRLPGYPRVMTVSLTLRGVGSSSPWQPFFDDEG